MRMMMMMYVIEVERFSADAAGADDVRDRGGEVQR
jgi:hypothetical protein